MHRLARRTAIMITLLGAAIMIVPVAAGGTGAGSVFNLGRVNSVNSTTTLTGRSTTRMLQVTNASSSGVALQLTTKTTAPPLKVNSSVKVANLNADRLDGLTSADFVRPRGETLISVGSGSWSQQNSASGLAFTTAASGAYFFKPTTGVQFIVAAPDLPVSQFGQAVELRGLQLCFANAANTSVTAVELAVSTTTDAGSTTSSALSDTTVRTGADCALFTLASPVQLESTTKATLFVTINWGVANQGFAINGATFILRATGTASTPLLP
jgi:hypothetical protein